MYWDLFSLKCLFGKTFKAWTRDKVIDFILSRKFTIPIIILSIVMGSRQQLSQYFSIIISETQSEYMKNLALLYFETTNGQVWLLRIISCAIIGILSYYHHKAITNETNGFILLQVALREQFCYIFY